VNRSFNALWFSLRSPALLWTIAILVVVLVPAGAGPATARYLFQSPVQTPTPEPPTPTPIPPSPTPVPPTPTPEPPSPTPEPPTPTPELPTPTPEPATPTPSLEVPTATPPPTEPAPTAPSEQPPAETPTAETIHLPAVERGGQAEQPPAPPEADQPPAPPPQPPPSAEEAEEIDLARLIDGLVVIFSYIWLTCGVVLLLTIPVVLVLLNRWGRRRRQS